MNEERLHPTPADPASTEPAAARAESCTCYGGGRAPDPTDDNLRSLRRLKDLALAVAEKVAARIVDDEVRQPAAPAAAPADGPDARDDTPMPPSQLAIVVLGFQRAERAVRQCVLLSTKLHQDRLLWETNAEAAAAKVEQQRRERRKSQIARLAKEAIERDAAESGEDTYERVEKIDARIDEEDIESDLGFLADSALVDRLCKDCGVEAPWDLWAGENWALEEVRLGPPGSVFAGLARSAPPETGAEEDEPVEADLPEPEPLEPEADEPAASAPEPEPPEPELPEPEPPKPEPDTSFEAQMKARLVMALRSGAWVMALQMDPRLASYVYSRLNDSS